MCMAQSRGSVVEDEAVKMIRVVSSEEIWTLFYK